MVRTFLLADVRGYTRYTREHGDEAASQVAGRLAALVGSTVPEFGGELLEVRGDETLCVFSSARQALRAAVEVQRRLRAPEDGEPFPLGVGMGLDAGEAVPTDGGYRGGALNMAGRLVAIAGPGEVRATERLVELTGQIEGLRWGEAKRLRLKGLDRPERVVSVEPSEPLPAPPRGIAHRRKSRWRRAGVAATAVLGVGVALLVYRHGNTDAAPVAIRPNSVAAFDPRLGRVVADVSVGGQPESVTAGFGKVWVGSQNGLISAVSPSNLRVESQGTSGDPAFLATGAGAVWSYDGKSRLTELAPSTMEVVEDRHLWPCNPELEQPAVRPPCTGGGITVAGSEVWLGRGGPRASAGKLERYDAATLRRTGAVAHVAIGNMTQAGGVVWSLGDGPGTSGMELDGIPIATGSVDVRRVLGSGIATSGNAGVSVGAGYVWAAEALGVLNRVDPDPTLASSEAVFPYQVPPGITAVLAQTNDIWVAEQGGALLDVNPYTGHVKHSYPLGHVTPVALTSEAGRIWAALAP